MNEQTREYLLEASVLLNDPRWDIRVLPEQPTIVLHGPSVGDLRW